MGYTRTVAEFVVGTDFESIPPGAIGAAKGAILDSVGVALAGSGESTARICAELAREEGANQEAGLFGQRFRSSSTSAAFANGVATHALDFDWSFSTQGQPMAGLMAAVFAVAEPLHASGRQVLEAYIAGFEVTAKLAWAMQRQPESRGWHAPGTIGSFGCTAAAAKLLGLDVDETCLALGIASSMASGIVSNFGTMSKPLHAGLGARNGVLAARLAHKGFTANPAPLEGPGGFFESYASPSPDHLTSLGELGEAYEVEGGVRVKPYPCGGLTHSSIDAALALRQEHGLTADQIDRVDVKVTAAVARRIVFGVPRTELEGKFSMPYVVARAILDGGLTQETFSDDAIRAPDALALLAKVHMEADARLTDDGRGRQPSEVTIRLRDGRSLFKRVDYAKGNPQSPFTPEELAAKFDTCARHALSEASASKARQLLGQLETLEDVGSLTSVLIGEPR